MLTSQITLSKCVHFQRVCVFLLLQFTTDSLSLGETLSNVLQSAHHHSSSPSLLVQRSVARHTMLGKTLAQGQFCEVYEGRWRSDRVLVKIYPSKYERLWFAETEIYQVRGCWATLVQPGFMYCITGKCMFWF